MSCLGKSRVGFRYVDVIRAHVLPMGFVSHRRKCPCVFFVFSFCLGNKRRRGDSFAADFVNITTLPFAKALELLMKDLKGGENFLRFLLVKPDLADKEDYSHPFLNRDVLFCL